MSSPGRYADVRMEFVEPGFVGAMRAYFEGEKVAGAALAVFGVVLLGAAYWVSRVHAGGFMLGLAIPFAIVGLAGLVGGIVLVVKTGPQVDALVQLYSSDVTGFVAQELPRMQKVNANWVRLEAVWTVMIAGGLGCIWLAQREWLHGLALALLVVGTTGMITDVISERRARVYTAELEALVPARS